MTAAQAARRVDIVVPVYNAPEDLRRCVDSVLACTSGHYRLLVIDDGSPDARIADVFDELARRGDPRIELARNARNCGFTATANRGMAASRSDVVLLNSDTVVTTGWLDALVRCAAADPLIATVTPFSNNAEICSFPRFCEDNGWTPHDDAERIRAALVDAAVPTNPDLPTGVGFCMYVRRAALDAIGAFDLAFGAGYGEENDFCLRAARAGWRNVLADDAFVVHLGGRSFADRKEALSSRNLELLQERHPHYGDMVRAYIAADPLRPLREAALCRLAIQALPGGVLHVIHDHGGGTERHVRDLIDASRDRFRHYLAIAVGDRWMVEAHRRDDSVAAFDFMRQSGETWRDFVAGLCATFEIGVVHLHNISGCRDGLLDALSDGSIPFGYTLHDLNFACPTITLLDATERYCGGVTDTATCNRCLGAQPAFARIDIAAWRARHAWLVRAAAFLVAPSSWVSAMFHRYFPGYDVAVIAHGTPARGSARAGTLRLGVIMPSDCVPVVAVLGAIGPDKGARRVERLVELAREQSIALRIVVIGYLDRQQLPWQSADARLTVHGRYDPQDLADLLAHYRVSLVLYPSVGPETFSYTLSEAWQAGVPTLVPPVGALAERLAASNAGWVMTDDEWTDDARMLERVIALSSASAADSRIAAARHARAARPNTTAEMADAALALYASAIERAGKPIAGHAFSNARIRDALGYRPWTPRASADMPGERASVTPPVAGGARVARSGLWAGLARRALAWRRTPVGRLLYRVTPAPLIDALKARLDG